MRSSADGRPRSASNDPGRPLRQDLRLTGTEYGCGEGRCGAGSARVGGRRMFSGRVPASRRFGARVRAMPIELHPFEKRG